MGPEGRERLPGHPLEEEIADVTPRLRAEKHKRIVLAMEASRVPSFNAKLSVSWRQLATISRT